MGLKTYTDTRNQIEDSLLEKGHDGNTVFEIIFKIPINNKNFNYWIYLCI